MSGIDDREVERRLREIPVASAPQDLRVRVLGTALRHKRAKSWTSPRQRLWLAACASALLAVLAADAFVSHAQRARLFALSGSTHPVAPRSDDQNGLLAEVIGKDVIPGPEAAALGSPEPRRAASRRAHEPQVRPASSLYEDLENELLLEESHDAPKSLH